MAIHCRAFGPQKEFFNNLSQQETSRIIVGLRILAPRRLRVGAVYDIICGYYCERETILMAVESRYYRREFEC